MRTQLSSYLLVALLAFASSVNADSGLAATGSTVVTIPVPSSLPEAPAPMAVSPVAVPVSSHRKAKRHHVNRPAAISVRTGETNLAQSTYLLEEAKNLIVPSQPYVIRYEDEESLGKVAKSENGSINTEFSPEEVEQYRVSVQTLGDYRSKMRNQCLGSSARLFLQSLDKYLSSLASFNRKALPLVADISENNSSLILVVNRTALVDAPVLISRYLQFKKQRFKETMGRFLPSDNLLVANMVSIARVLKVDVSDDDFNRSYGLRDNALELVSLWPREVIFEATEKLSEAHETACVVDLRAPESRKPKTQVSAISPTSTQKLGE